MALSTATENVELTQGLDQSLVCAAGVALAAALLETGDPARAVNALVQSSGGDELVLIPGVWRARSLELLTRCWLALGRREEAERAAARADAAAAALKLRVARSMADRALAAVALDAGDADIAADRALASAGPRRRGRHAGRRRRVTNARRAALSRKPASASVPSLNCSMPPQSFTPVVRSDTEPRLSASCDGSANTSTDARSPARPTDPASSR